MNIKKLSSKVVEKLGYYVYLYRYPLDGPVFYVGKGKGSRILTHLNDKSESRKVEIIEKIRKNGAEPVIEILVHGLQDEMTALRIEAAVIDLLGVKSLANQVRGYGSGVVGRVEIKQLIAMYDSDPVEVDEPAILIRVNKLYRYGMTAEELYEATRGVWKLGERRLGAKYAFAVYKGIVREAYEIGKWHPAGTTRYRTRSRDDVKAPGRWEFEGKLASDVIRRRYIDKSVDRHFAGNSQNPITYVNC